MRMMSLRSSLRRVSQYRWKPPSCSHSTSTTPFPAGARTRFAPSPTGYLHLGSLRTALFNYLIAKAADGKFLLRIEDTDQRRTIPDSEARLCDDLKWLGLDWDEGPGVGGPYAPYRQSERTELYREHAQKLLDSGNAYRCFCSSERIREVSKADGRYTGVAGYDRKCHSLAAEESDERAFRGEAHVIRLLLPPKPIPYKDLVFGLVNAKSRLNVASLYEDPILMKTDGFPTYHLANVVDDHHMKISHVIRGSEWLPSTPMHSALYKAFGWEPPTFGHVGLLVNLEGKKLSKRNSEMDDITRLRERGIRPEALINFTALLGSSYDASYNADGRREERMSVQELIKKFKSPGGQKFTRGDVKVTFKKLHYFQNHAMLKLLEDPSSPEVADLVQRNKEAVDEMLDTEVKRKERVEILDGRDETEYLKSILRFEAEGSSLITANAAEKWRYFFTRPTKDKLIEILPRILQSKGYNQQYNEMPQVPITEIVDFFQNKPVFTEPQVPGADPWNHDLLKQIYDIKEINDRGGSGRAFSYLRWALIGGKSGLGIFDVLQLLGVKESLRRLALAAEVVKSGVVDLNPKLIEGVGRKDELWLRRNLQRENAGEVIGKEGEVKPSEEESGVQQESAGEVVAEEKKVVEMDEGQVPIQEEVDTGERGRNN